MIGIDPGWQGIRLVDLRRRWRRWQLRACCCLPLEPSLRADVNALSAALKTAAVRRGFQFWRCPEVAMALPVSEITVNTRPLPDGATEEEAEFIAKMEAGPEQLMDYRCITRADSAAELLLLSCPQGCRDRFAMLAAAAGGHLAALGVDVLQIADRFAAEVPSGIDLLLVDMGSASVRLSVFRDRLPVYWRNHAVAEGMTSLSVLVRALQHYRMTEMPAAGLHVLLYGSRAADPEIRCTLESFCGVEPETLDPFAALGLSAPVGICPSEFVLACALASQELP